MRSTFALLANTEVYNLVRHLSWEMHSACHTGTTHCRLEPHISLKQTFHIDDLDALEAYMAELAASIQPFDVTLTELQVQSTFVDGIDYGILWIAVDESDKLCGLHNRLNDELHQRFGDTRAQFDGPDYRFHMTVMIGGQPVEVYRQYLATLPTPRVDLRFTVRTLAMFVYDEPFGPDSDYLSYKILPLGA